MNPEFDVNKFHLDIPESVYTLIQTEYNKYSYIIFVRRSEQNDEL